MKFLYKFHNCIRSKIFYCTQILKFKTIKESYLDLSQKKLSFYLEIKKKIFK